MSQDPHRTAREIEETREDLARKVDELVDQARVEAGVLGRKAAVGGLGLAGLLVLGFIAKRRVRN